MAPVETVSYRANTRATWRQLRYQWQSGSCPTRGISAVPFHSRKFRYDGGHDKTMEVHLLTYIYIYWGYNQVGYQVPDPEPPRSLLPRKNFALFWKISWSFRWKNKQPLYWLVYRDPHITGYYNEPPYNWVVWSPVSNKQPGWNEHCSNVDLGHRSFSRHFAVCVHVVSHDTVIDGIWALPSIYWKLAWMFSGAKKQKNPRNCMSRVSYSR